MDVTRSVLRLHNVVTFPTRGNSKIDCCFSTNKSYKCQKLSPIGKSDHCMFKCTPAERIVSKRSFSHKYIPDFSPSNRLKFEQTLAECNLLLDIQIQNSIDLNFQYDYFIQMYQSVFENSFPLRKVKVNRDNLPWISDTIRQCIRKRDKFYKNNNMPKFKHYRSKVKNLLRNAKSQYVAGIHKLSDKESWQKIKSLGNFQLKSEKHRNFSAKELLQQFTSIENRNDLFLNEEFLLASEEKVPAWIIQNYLFYFIKPLYFIFSESINLGIVPDSLKMATITPVPKSKKPASPADYRPITSSSPFLKCFESIVIKKWFKPLVKESTFGDQFAFVPLKGRGCTSALVCIYGHAVHLLDRGYFVNLALVDFSKAFDRACKVGIIDALLSEGASQQCVQWTYSFLSDRKVRVKTNNDVSDLVSVDVGTPQGSKLSPLLFAFLCSTLKSVTSNCIYIKYADDLSIIHYTKTGDDIDLRNELAHINRWCKENNMLINVNKTKIIHISGRKTPSPPTIQLHNKAIECVSSSKLLGLTIEKTMKWNVQVDESIKKASKIFYSIVRLKNARCSTNILHHFYKAVVRPHLTYAFAATCNMNTMNLNRLIKAEKRFNRLMGLPVHPHLKAFCNSITEKLVKQVKSNNDHPIRQLLIPIQPTRTRQRRDTCIPKGKSSLYLNSFVKHFI